MKKWFVIALVLLIAGAALGCGVLLSGDFEIEKFYNEIYEPAEYLCNEDVDSIIIRDNSQDIEILAAHDGKCRLEYVVGQHDDYAILLDDGRLSIMHEIKMKNRLSFGFAPDRTMKLYLPAGEYESLYVESTSGDVTVTDGFAFSDISITAASGDIGVLKCKAGSLSIHTASGDISLLMTSAETAEIEASSGDVDIYDTSVAGVLMIDTASGDVTFDNLAADDIDVSTASGDVEGIIAGGMQYETSTSSGSVRIPESTAEGGICRVETASGDIDIRTK